MESIYVKAKMVFNYKAHNDWVRHRHANKGGINCFDMSDRAQKRKWGTHRNGVFAVTFFDTHYHAGISARISTMINRGKASFDDAMLEFHWQAVNYQNRRVRWRRSNTYLLRSMERDLEKALK